MPRSSLKNVKNAKTPNNVDNRNVHRATKSGRTHGEVMLGGYRQQRPVVALPKATTSSSSRQKAASVYHDVKAAMKTRAQRKNHNKKRNKKKKKQNEALIEVPLDKGIPVSPQLHNTHMIFANGDNNSATLHPKPHNPKNMPFHIIEIAGGDLFVPQAHLNDPTKGLIARPEDPQAPLHFLLAPRISVLNRTACSGNPDTNKGLCNAFDACESEVRVSLKRGNKKQVILENPKDKYMAQGNQTRRARTGIEPISYALKNIPQDDARTILKWIRSVEFCLFEWIDTAQIGRSCLCTVRDEMCKNLRIELLLNPQLIAFTPSNKCIGID